MNHDEGCPRVIGDARGCVAMQVSTMQNGESSPDIVSKEKKKRNRWNRAGLGMRRDETKSPGTERAISLYDIGSVEGKVGKGNIGLDPRSA